MSGATDVVLFALQATGAVVWLGLFLWGATLACRQVRRRLWLLAIPTVLVLAAYAFHRQPEVCAVLGGGFVAIALVGVGLLQVSTRPRLAALVITALAGALAFAR
ncbi:MAG: hypothetical protein ABW352_13210 [Polyangiales bacterium]